MPNVEVIPEVKYGKSERKTVDWFVVCPDVVLLVEVKAPRLTEEARMGEEQLAGDLLRTIGKARSQIDVTAEILQASHPALIKAGVPVDLPLRGLIVTLEPYHLVQSPLVEPLLARARTTTTVASIHDLEHMVGFALAGIPMSEQLERIQDDPDSSGYSPMATVRQLWPDHVPTNPLLEAAKLDLPWREAMAKRAAQEIRNHRNTEV